MSFNPASEMTSTYAVMGITGNVGGQVANVLLSQGKRVRAVVRDRSKARAWELRGCEVVVADVGDADALTAALIGATAAFIMVPPVFDPLPEFPEAQRMAKSIRSAVDRGHPGRVVYMSTIGADATQVNLLTQHTIIEAALSNASVPITFLRPAWFMENFLWDVPAARGTGVIPSFLQPLDKPLPMVATADIGTVAARIMQEQWHGLRTVDLEGPERVSPNMAAVAFAKVLRRSVKMDAVPRTEWEALFRSQGMKNPAPRMRMLDGFNEGWINFERSAVKGPTRLETVLEALVASTEPS